MSGSRHKQHQLPSDSSPPDGGQPPPPGLSAQGSFLSGIADSGSAAGGFGAAGGMFLGESPSAASESSCKSTASATTARDFEHCRGAGKPSHQQQQQQPAPYGVWEGSTSGNSLLRHSSSPAGFFFQSGFQVPRDFGSCSSRPGRLKSQLSFSGRGGLTDIGESAGCNNSSDVTSGGGTPSYMSSNFSIGSWGDTNSIVFSAPNSGKRAKDGNCADTITLSNINAAAESQFGFPNTALEMATVDKYLRLQHDQTPLKVRAKRGCATHPRSIAERERRTRISDKLKNLQELVPNMDKQTSTADMLDLAVKHIRGLQNQVQILQKEQENCECRKK